MKNYKKKEYYMENVVNKPKNETVHIKRSMKGWKFRKKEKTVAIWSIKNLISSPHVKIHTPSDIPAIQMTEKEPILFSHLNLYPHQQIGKKKQYESVMKQK